MYLSKECPQQSLPRVLTRLLLPTVCRVLLFLGVLTPFSSHSTSTGPFSLPASASPVSPVSLPSFVFLPCSQTDFSSRNPSSNPSTFALQDPLLRIKEENPAASQAGIDLRSLPEGTKKLLNAWGNFRVDRSVLRQSPRIHFIHGRFTRGSIESGSLFLLFIEDALCVPCFSLHSSRFAFLHNATARRTRRTR